jgi:hypothetical protein
MRLRSPLVSLSARPPCPAPLNRTHHGLALARLAWVLLQSPINRGRGEKPSLRQRHLNCVSKFGQNFPAPKSRKGDWFGSPDFGPLEIPRASVGVLGLQDQVQLRFMVACCWLMQNLSDHGLESTGEA